MHTLLLPATRMSLVVPLGSRVNVDPTSSPPCRGGVFVHNSRPGLWTNQMQKVTVRWRERDELLPLGLDTDNHASIKAFDEAFHKRAQDMPRQPGPPPWTHHTLSMGVVETYHTSVTERLYLSHR